jgi:flotillin
MGATFYIMVGAGLIALLTFSTILFVARRYKRCPSNAILVIYGKVRGGQSSRTIHGGAAFVIPLLQDYAFLSLEPIQIEIPLEDALSIENIRVNVPSVITVAIGTDADSMNNAAIRLLGLPSTDIKKQAEDIIFGQLRQVIASMSIDEINRDRESFLHNIQTSMEPELRKIGMVLININIKDITDESGYIEAIGRNAASQAIQQARGDVAEQEKLGETRVAQAERDKSVQVAEANKERNIGIRERQRDQAVRIAEMEKEQGVGEETASFQRDTQVKTAEQNNRIAVAAAEAAAVEGEKNAERDKRIAVATTNATAINGENEAQARIAASNAGLQVERAAAYQSGETKQREAEAAVLEAQNLALAKAALAEAEKVEAERRAQLEAPAKAEKAQTIVEAEAAAEKRRIIAEGEAKAIFAKLEAEANGQYEILAKKGDGLKRIVEACGGSEAAFRMLMLEHLDTMAETAATAISNIKFDKVIVWENGGGNGESATSNFLNNMATSLPPMMNVMKDIGGVEMPDYLLKMNGEAEDGNGSSTASPTPDGGATAVAKAPAVAKPKPAPKKDEGKPPKES